MACKWGLISTYIHWDDPWSTLSLPCRPLTWDYKDSRMMCQQLYDCQQNWVCQCRKFRSPSSIGSKKDFFKCDNMLPLVSDLEEECFFCIIRWIDSAVDSQVFVRSYFAVVGISNLSGGGVLDCWLWLKKSCSGKCHGICWNRSWCICCFSIRKRKCMQ